ncbi:hypothetical protein CCACVL1_06142 [Corchorus capsularis]|uniref:hAT-like transposase RNase-H fold domain-containing protein n=1 Tax=Corchorus capsularis TaxID=210143 RepID=A0A1R3JH42_COCAP|nr:hypothetical protein CCACVL1_06142 [Corchorus capsularis]
MYVFIYLSSSSSGLVELNVLPVATRMSIIMESENINVTLESTTPNAVDKYGTCNLLCHCDACTRRDSKDVKQIILSSEQGDGLKELDELVYKMRESIKHVKGSQVRKQKFIECVKLVSLNSKRGLRQDIQTRWNSTYLMLESSIYFRKAFAHLEISDSNFKSCPSKDEWDRIERLTAFLADFYEIFWTFSGTKYPTANLYFPSIFMTCLSLEEHKNGEDDYMKNMVTRMYAKFEKYWYDFNLILAIAVTLDPHYKLQFVEYSYQTMHGENSEQFSKIPASLYGPFNDYVAANASTSTSKSNTSSSASETQIEQPLSARSSRFETSKKKFLKDYQSFESAKFGAMMEKSKLDLYLEEKL